MSDPNKEFADAVAASMNQDEGAPAADDAAGNVQPAEADPILEYAKAIKDAGIAPDKARDLVQKFAYLQTPQGQQEFIQGYFRSEAGAGLRQQLGNESLANSLATNPEAVLRIAKELHPGLKFPGEATEADDEMTTPEMRKIRAMEAQQQALEASIKGLREQAATRINDLEGKVRGRDEAEARVGAFVEWAKTQPPMAQQARAVVAGRANELAVMYPEKYSGYQGFKRAAADAYSEISNAAQYFQPKPRPRNGTHSGGGVAGKSVDNSKMTLSELIDAASEDFARASRGED